MNKNTTFKIILLTGFILLLSQCKPPKEPNEKKFGIITFIKGDAFFVKGDKEEKLHNGDIIQPDSTIKTGKKSFLDITFNDHSIVRLKENTKVQLMEMALSKKGGHLTSLNINEGKIINVVSKVQEDGFYTVKSQTMVAGVRGTVFEVAIEGDTSVFVAEGNVEVQSNIGKKDTHNLKANNGVTIKQNQDTLFENEKKTKELLADSIDMKNHTISQEQVKMTSKLANVKSEEDLKKAFNKDIELIIMKDGRLLRGVVVSMAEGKLLVQTVKGSHFINEADVEKVELP